MKQLPPKDPAERKLLRFSFASDMAHGETISSADVAVELLRGVDSTPGNVLDGLPVVDVNAQEVLQWIDAGAPNADYGLRCLVTASGGAIHLASARLPVRRL